MKYYFYCPNCKCENVTDKLPEGTVGNIRDGYGTPIHHYECPMCHNLDAGYMSLRICENNTLDEYTKLYFQEVIEMYQGIRGFASTNKTEHQERNYIYERHERFR